MPCRAGRDFFYESSSGQGRGKKSCPVTVSVIDHHCSFFELYSLIHHTPQLRHLICRKIIKKSDHLGNEQAITLLRLTNITMDICVKSPDHFGLFMTKLFAPVQALRIRYHRKTDHLDDNGWEQLIRTNLPYLNRFHYENHQCSFRYNANEFDYTKFNQFTSPFWVERQWSVELALNMHTKCLYCSDWSQKYIHFKSFLIMIISSFFSVLHGLLFLNIQKYSHLLIRALLVTIVIDISFHLLHFVVMVILLIEKISYFLINSNLFLLLFILII
jgi:hypothetical protein